MNEFQLKCARWISVIGHPFLLMPVLTAIIAWQVLPPQRAIIVELVALGVVIVPAGIYTLVRVRRGTWGDLDVSDRRERNQFYVLLLPLLVTISVIAWIAEVPHEIPAGALAILLLVGAAYTINPWVKVSLHTGFGVFVALTLFFINPGVAGAALLLACLVGWSRIVLGRHTPAEVALGGGLGVVVAAGFLLTMLYFT